MELYLPYPWSCEQEDCAKKKTCERYKYHTSIPMQMVDQYGNPRPDLQKWVIPLCNVPGVVFSMNESGMNFDKTYCCSYSTTEGWNKYEEPKDESI